MSISNDTEANRPLNIPLEWVEWILECLKRECVLSDMVRIMAENGIPNEIAPTWIDFVKQYAGNNLVSDYQYEPSRIPHKNTFDIDDRTINVALRIAEPEIILFGNVLSNDECDALVELAKPKIERSKVVGYEDGVPFVDDVRTSFGASFMRGETELLNTIDLRLAKLAHWPVENGEGIQVLNYQIGAEYKPHFDYFSPEVPGSTAYVDNGGQRVATFVIYLCDVEEGGETIFPDIGVSIFPKKGCAVYFSYFNSKKQLDRMTLHGGSPVISGEKWIATKWMREFASIF